MNRNFCKSPTTWLVAMTLLPLSACNDFADSTSSRGQEDGGMVVFPKFLGLPYQNSSEEESEKLTEVNVFHFNGEDFFLRTDISDPYAETVELPTNGTTKVYCVAGTQVAATEGVKETDFLNTTVSVPANATTSPIFYSGTSEFSEEVLRGGRLDIELTRSVARIDFTNTIDPDIVIKKLIVENAPASTFVFAQDSICESSTVSFTREFAEPFYGEEAGIFYLYESANPVNVRIIGEYGDSPLNISATLQSVERNKVYNLQMINLSSNVQGAFTVKDWEEGSNADALPSTNHDIFIDKLNSSIPEGVTVDYGKNVVTVPFAGAKNIKLAFLAETEVTIASIEGEVSTAKITTNQPVKVEEGYISSINVTIDPNKRLSYTLLINLKDGKGRYNFVEIKVLNDTTRVIETVEIAGATWMAFNCTGPDLDKQIYPVDGLSVEETYRNNFVGAVGYLYQFGRQYAYNPYLSYNPCNNLGNQVQNMPWVDYSHMPCPEGYHVATLEELRTLCPSGTKIPGTYTAGNGESITVTVHAAEGTLVTPTNVGGTARYMKFKSNKTGNVLILPISGYKGDKSTASNPGFGKDVVYWTNSNISCWGGHARAFRFMFNNGNEAIMEEFQWPMEAFSYVRAIKNVESNEE